MWRRPAETGLIWFGCNDLIELALWLGSRKDQQLELQAAQQNNREQARSGQIGGKIRTISIASRRSMF